MNIERKTRNPNPNPLIVKGTKKNPGSSLRQVEQKKKRTLFLEGPSQTKLEVTCPLHVCIFLWVFFLFVIIIFLSLK